MPNWNEAEFEVVGDKEVIDEILKTDFDFDKIRPEPQDLMEQPDVPNESMIKMGFKDATSPAWYEWRLKNWGTKWKPTRENNNLDLNRVSNTKLNVIMTTAWCLPIEILKFLTFKYPVSIAGTTREETEDHSLAFVVEKGAIRGQ